MTKEEINSLKETQETVNKLFNLINTSILNEEVLFATYKLASIFYKDQQYEQVVKILIDKLSYFNHQKENKLYFKFLALITNSYLNLKDKKNASYYIELKKEVTPHLEEQLYYYDVLTYKQIFNEDLRPILLKIVDKPFAKDSFYNFYLQAFAEQIQQKSEEVSNYYQLLLTIGFSDEQIKIIKSMYIDYLYNINNFEELEKVIQLEPQEVKSYIKTLLLIEEGLLIKVQLYEAEQEKEFEKLSLERQKILFKKLKDFYYDKDNLSYDLYNKKYNAIKNIKEDKKNKKEHKPQYIIPTKLKKLEIEDVLQEKESLITQDKDLKILDQIIKELLSLKTETTLFNKIRSISMVLETYLSFSDILYNFNGKFYHYKKQRLYEKNYDLHTVDATVLGISANQYVDIVEKVEDIKYNYDLLTNKPLTDTKVKQVYCYGLIDKSSVCFYQNRLKGIHLDRELFKVISNFISYELLYFNKLKTYNKAHQLTDAIFKTDQLMMFTYKNNLIGNKLFNDTFKLSKYDDVDTLISNFTPSEQREFQKQIQLLRRRKLASFVIEVSYNDKIYLFTNYLSNGYLIGVFNEITNYKKELKKWQEKAFVDPLSNVLTLHEFEVSFNDYIDGKTTFILIELADLEQIQSLYGKQLKQQYFYEFTSLAKNHFDQLYQFDSNTLLAVINKNDIRTILKIVNDFYEVLDKYNSKTLQLAKMNSFMGIIRYPIQTKEKNIFKIYQYLSISLLKAKQQKDNNRYHLFHFDDYQQDVFETEVLRQIDRLIVEENLQLSFTQILNQKTNKVYAYQVGVYSESLLVYESYYYQLAKTRGLLPKLEKYIIKQTFIALKQLYNNFNSYIEVSVNLSEETLKEPDIITFLLTLQKEYKVPLNLIELVYTSKYSRLSSQLLSNLAKHGFKIGVVETDFVYFTFVSSYYFEKSIKPFTSKLQNFLSQLNKYCQAEEINFIVHNVDDETEKNQLQGLEIDYIRGKLTDKVFSFDELVYLIKKTVKSL